MFLIASSWVKGLTTAYVMHGISYHGNFIMGYLTMEILTWDIIKPWKFLYQITYRGNLTRQQYGHSSLLSLSALGGGRFAQDRIRWRTKSCVFVVVSSSCCVTVSNLRRRLCVDVSIGWERLTLVLAIVTKWGQPMPSSRIQNRESGEHHSSNFKLSLRSFLVQV